MGEAGEGEGGPVKLYLYNLLIGLDQFANVVLGGAPDQTISSRCWKHRGHWAAAMAELDIVIHELIGYGLWLYQRKWEREAEIDAAVQSRLDDFAHTKNYDGILSLCTYASSTNPAFAAEGQTGVDLRDATWAKLYQILGEVQALMQCQRVLLILRENFRYWSGDEAIPIQSTCGL